MAGEHDLDRLLLTESTMDPASPAGAGGRVCREVAARTIRAFIVRDLDIPALREGQALHGVSFEVGAGTLTLLSPRGPGRTVVCCLAGGVSRRGGVVDVEEAGSTRRVETTAWRLALARDPGLESVNVSEVLNASGGASAAVARRLRLGARVTTPVSELSRLERMLLGVAVALADAPDVVALDRPCSVLDDADVELLIDFIRDLVDLEGRTVLVVDDLEAVPPQVIQLFDQTVDLGQWLQDLGVPMDHGGTAD